MVVHTSSYAASVIFRILKSMNRMLLFIGMIVGGYVGWWAGDYIGFGLMGTFLVSSLGSAAGVYLAWRVLRDYLGG